MVLAVRLFVEVAMTSLGDVIGLMPALLVRLRAGVGALHQVGLPLDLVEVALVRTNS